MRFEGYAEDYGVPIVTVQFSLDDGENWTDYDVSGSDGRSMGALDLRVHARGAGNLLPARALGQRARRGDARSPIPPHSQPSCRKVRGRIARSCTIGGAVRAPEQISFSEGPGSSGPLSMATHKVIVVDLLQAATSLGARPCRGPLCWYTVRRINGLRVSQVKVEKYAHGQRGSPSAVPPAGVRR